MFHFYCVSFLNKESKLRPCDQLSKYVGPLDTIPTQTIKGEDTSTFVSTTRRKHDHEANMPRDVLKESSNGNPTEVFLQHRKK
jgi:hypothetical protein